MIPWTDRESLTALVSDDRPGGWCLVILLEMDVGPAQADAAWRE